MLQQPRLGPAELDVGVLRDAEPLEPELGPCAVAVREVEVGEPEQRLATRLAAGLGDGERPQERVARLLDRAADALARTAEADPHLGAGRDASGELLERERELGVEPRRLAGVREQREPERRVRDALEHRLRRPPRGHRVAARERLFTVAEVALDPCEHDLDATEPASDGLRETHASCLSRAAASHVRA